MRPRPATLTADVEIALLATLPVVVAIGATSTPALIGRFVGGCLFHAVTGFPCPTCGVTRALVALSRGHWRAALCVQPLVTVAATVLLLYFPWALGVVTRGWRPWRPALRGPRGRLLRAAIVAAIVANWAYLIRAGV